MCFVGYNKNTCLLHISQKNENEGERTVFSEEKELLAGEKSSHGAVRRGASASPCSAYYVRMLPRVHRLHGGRDIRAVFRRGRKKETAFFTVWVADKGAGLFRGLVIVPKVVDKRATLRYTLKRRVREVLRTIVAPSLPTSDIIVRLKPGGKTISKQEFKKQLLNVIHIP